MFLAACRGQRNAKGKQLDPEVYIDTREGRVALQAKTPCNASTFSIPQLKIKDFRQFP